MSTLGTVHFVFAWLAMAAGAWVLMIPKGTRWHRTLGHLYVGGMLGLNVTALCMYQITGRFGPFHVFAVVALVTLGFALYSVLLRRPQGGWIEAHAVWMSWSYIGLIAAAVSEISSRMILPLVADRLQGSAMGAFWGVVTLATVTVVLTGRLLIARRLAASVASTPAAMRRERTQMASLEAGTNPG